MSIEPEESLKNGFGCAARLTAFQDAMGSCEIHWRSTALPVSSELLSNLLFRILVIAASWLDTLVSILYLNVTPVMTLAK